MSEVFPCPSPCPRFLNMPVSEVVSVSVQLVIVGTFSKIDSVNQYLEYVHKISATLMFKDTNWRQKIM